MANLRDQRLVAAALFDQIGDDWDEDTWGSWESFAGFREIAQSVRDLHGADGSGSTIPALREYNDSVGNLFRAKYAGAVTRCITSGTTVPNRLNVYLQITENGRVADADLLDDYDMNACMLQAVQNARFAAPSEGLVGPHKRYLWVQVPLRPLKQPSMN